MALQRKHIFLEESMLVIVDLGMTGPVDMIGRGPPGTRLHPRTWQAAVNVCRSS